MGKSIRSIAKELGVDHSTLIKTANGTYGANPKNIVDKLLKAFGGVIIPADKFDEVLTMLNNAVFPQKFGEAQRTASWLYELIKTSKRAQIKNEEQL